MKKQNKVPNVLDLIPVQSQKFKSEIDETGKVTIFVENKGLFNWIAQKLLNKPKVSQVHLEDFGCFIWKQIDGIKSVKEIADLVHQEFGEKADPLYPRISMYMNTLLTYEFIEWKNK